MAEQLVDIEARKLVETVLDECMCVEAGAGTGKTTLMVKRIVNLIKADTPIQGIVAITFTEKAASELRQRLRASLEAGAATASAEGDARTAESLGKAARDMGQAAIGTIHSYASSLLREYPAEAGIDPGFALLDEIAVQKLREDAWEAWLQKVVQTGSPELTGLLEMGCRLKDFKDMAFALCRSGGHAPISSAIQDPPDTSAHWIQFLEAERVCSGLMALCRKQDDAAVCSCRTLSGLCGDFGGTEHTPDLNGWIRLLRMYPSCGGRTGSKANWSGTALQEVRDSLAMGKEACLQAVKELGGWFLMRTLRVAEGLSAYYEGSKAAKGVLDFDDLLVKARDLVRTSRSARSSIQNRTSNFLVDEFQDTDELQAEMIFLLAGSDPDMADWRNIVLKPGKLFIVGDPKQSIYRFRGADIEVYERAKSIIARQGRVVSIFQNFRSVSPIIEWTNKCFKEIMKRPDDGDYQPDYMALEPTQGKDLQGSRVIVLGSPDSMASDDGGKVSADALRREEARLISETIWDLVNGGYGTTLSSDPSPKRYGDIAILFPTRNSLEIYEDALNSLAIPYSMDGGKSYYARQEVDFLISLLKAISNPRDEVPILAALRSPHFCIPDPVLLSHKVRGGNFNYLEPGRAVNGLDPGLAEAFGILAGLHAAKGSVGTAKLIMMALDATHALQFLMTRKKGRQSVYNLMKVCELARNFEESGSPTLTAFTDWLEDQRKIEAAEAESPESEASDDVVQLMTIHKSKGLEFPVVILANLASKPRVTGGSYMLNGALEYRKGIPDAKDQYLATPGYEVAKASDAAREAAEKIRLLYVAVTRPRELLVVPALCQGEGTLLGHLIDHLPMIAGASSGQPPRTRVNPMVPVSRDVADSELVRHFISARNMNMEALKDLISRSSEPRALSRPSGGHAPDPEPDRVDTVDVSYGSGGTIIGTVFHKAMELAWPVKGRVGTDPMAASVEACSLNGCPENVTEVRKLVVSCLSTPGVSDLFGCRAVHHEVPFAVRDPRDPSGLTICEGVMDMICEFEDGSFTVVDFKSDRISKESVDARFREYMEQGLLYGAAVDGIAPGRLKEVLFIFARPQETRSLYGEKIQSYSAGSTA